ncbi:transmembrane protein 104 homolog [Adelges cooleyi]|uniref:transmembrane protein 104 homolog n=1 Tax=Adelges cooleyi TaxID=133065 RepID=UPI0021809208|nr:transmembrane protein 104 homolog [Adelges cooleyi]XP_050423232.1 transmembrane protein 104 homolog [Adelges cooleyi]
MSSSYSSSVGLIFVFNLIIGPGALTLPAVVQQTGWFLSSVFIAVLAFFSYLTFTFIIESITITNAITQLRKLQMMKNVTRQLKSCKDMLSQVTTVNCDRISTASTDSFNTDDEAPIFDNPAMASSSSLMDFPPESVQLLSLDNRIELGEMVTVLLPPFAKVLFFISLCGYLFGDISIYYKAIGRSFVKFTCNNNKTNETNLCWEDSSYTKHDVYLAYLGLYLIIVGPFTFFNVQKTKHLQVFSFIMRVTAMLTMFTLAVLRIITPTEDHGDPPAAYFPAIPQLIGASIYAFMCHHSIPSVIAPIKNKNNLMLKIASDFLFIYSLYMCLCISGAYAFPKVNEFYTINFTPTQNTELIYKVIDSFLVLFPVLTISISFPIIAITLRNNLQVMLLPEDAHWAWKRIVLPLFTLITPMLLAVFVSDLEDLVAIVAVYAGTGIQYVTPSLLVIAARAEIPQQVAGIKNDFCSPFKSKNWPIAILIWSVICVVVLTNFFIFIK